MSPHSTLSSSLCGPFDFARQAAAEMSRLAADLERDAADIDALAAWTAQLLVGGACLLVCGNGVSAAEAQHFAAELTGRYQRERPPLPAMALTADGALLMGISNDYSVDTMFARQVQALGRPGDLLVGMSTSGRSRNVVEAVAVARKRGLHTLALLGKDGGELAGMADREWSIPSATAARIQEAHLLFIHVVCDHIDAALVAAEKGETPHVIAHSKKSA